MHVNVDVPNEKDHGDPFNREKRQLVTVLKKRWRPYQNPSLNENIFSLPGKPAINNFLKPSVHFERVVFNG